MSAVGTGDIQAAWANSRFPPIAEIQTGTLPAIRRKPIHSTALPRAHRSGRAGLTALRGPTVRPLNRLLRNSRPRAVIARRTRGSQNNLFCLKLSCQFGRALNSSSSSARATSWAKRTISRTIITASSHTRRESPNGWRKQPDGNINARSLTRPSSRRPSNKDATHGSCMFEHVS